MKLSRGYWKTYKENPADAEIPSHRLMMRAGLISKTGAGLYNYLPMGLRSIRKVSQIVREEMDKAGCLELLMSMVTPSELWKESGRWELMGEMLKAVDKKNREICLSPTNEETVSDIFRNTIKSYKDLPVTLYQVGTKFRDEIRPRFGLMRAREFIMKDAYSFHIDKACLDETYQKLFQAYSNIFERIGLEFFAVEADAGDMAEADQQTHEFQVIADTGEDEIIYAPQSGYAANIEKAQTKRVNLNFEFTDKEMEKVPTPGISKIVDICKHLNRELEQSIKSLVFIAEFEEETRPYMIQLLGDDELSELKLKNAIGARSVRAARDDELKELELNKGYIGPLNISEKITPIFDKGIDPKASYTIGGGEVDTHYLYFVPSRDMGEFEAYNLRNPKLGDVTLDGHETIIKRGIEVGHIFQLGDKYTKSMSASVTDVNGKAVFPLMGCYGVGITRTVAAAIEQSHDDSGIIWPKSIAPYHIHLVSIAKSPESEEVVSDLYSKLQSEGFEVLLDDRKMGPGAKFKDADLLGLPIRVTFGERDFKASGELEVKSRKASENDKVKLDDLVDHLKKLWSEL